MLEIVKAALAAAVVASSSLTAVAPAHAQPEVGVAEGVRCSFSSLTDPTIDNEVQTAEIDGGPLVATAPGATISMTCTIQVGAANATHNGTDSCAVTVAPTPQVTTVPPTLCSYASPDGQPVYLCTEATIDGITYYWDNWLPGTGTWTTSSGAFCAGALPSGPILPGPLCPTFRPLYPGIPGIVDVGWDGDLYVFGFWLVDCHPRNNPLPGPFLPDPILCPILQASAGTYGPIIIRPDSDVYVDFDGDNTGGPDELFWDCPPYGS